MTITSIATTYAPGDHVKVLYFAKGIGTCLAATTVVAVEERPGKAARLAVVAPDNAEAAENGVLNLYAHGDFVTKYDPADERLRNALNLGYHIGLNRIRQAEGYKAHTDEAAGTMLQAFCELLGKAETQRERHQITAGFLAEYDRVRTFND